jgi:hypothetical protein
VDKVSGDEAEALLAAAWKKIFGCSSSGQEIIHVLAQPSVKPAWIADFGPFQEWQRNDCQASDDLWQSFAQVAESWPYIVSARRAAVLGIPNTRTFILGCDPREPMPSWLRYLSEVHLPAISALSGERLYRIRAADCRAEGIPVREHDVNLFGAAGVMIAGGDNGDIEWRAFLDSGSDPDLFREEHEFVTSMRDFAAACGEPVALPAVLSDAKD